MAASIQNPFLLYFKKLWIYVLLLLGIFIPVFIFNYHAIACGCIHFERRLFQGNGVVVTGYPEKDLKTFSELKRKLKINETCLGTHRQGKDTHESLQEWQRKGLRDAHILPNTVCRKLFPHNISSDFRINADESLYYQHVFHDCPALKQRVPSIVHFVWFYGNSVPFRFHHLLSALSVLRILKPCHIVFWTKGFAPAGKWWEYLTAEVDKSATTLLLETITPPACIMEKHVYKYTEHQADWTKLMIMHEIGGIALDLDVLILKPFDPLMCYDFTMGREQPRGLNIGLMIGVPGSQFVKLWFESYKTFQPHQFGTQGVHKPHEIFCHHPDLVHVEDRTMHYPLWTPAHIKLIYGENETYDWAGKQNYALHLWYRKYDVEHNPDDIKTLRSTFGSMARLIYYGSPDVIT